MCIYDKHRYSFKYKIKKIRQKVQILDIEKHN